nr:hypothetical protein [Bacteroidales bacterium]
LPNYTPQNRAEKKMHDLWLRFLTEIDENTDDADPELLANEETFEALEIVRRSAFTPGELLAYNQYWLNISTEKSAMERERAEGRLEGEKIGIEKGRAEQLVESIKNIMSSGFDFDNAVKMLKIPADQIPELKRLIY